MVARLAEFAYGKSWFTPNESTKKPMIKKKNLYLAGLWKKNLLEDLTWFTSYPTSRPRTWRAPSWSWAAVDSVILYDRNDSGVLEDLVPLCTVLDIECTSLGPDSFGEVSSGYIVLTGAVRPLRLEQYSLWPSQKSSE